MKADSWLRCSALWISSTLLVWAGPSGSWEEPLLQESAPPPTPSGWFAPLRTTIDLGMDTRRLFKGFTLSRENWWWANVDLMTYPFHIYATLGRADDGFDELDVGAGYFIDLTKNVKIRLGLEWEHYGNGDLFILDNYVSVNTVYYETFLGRLSAEWAYELEFDGDLFRLGLLTKPVPLTEQLSVHVDANLRYSEHWFGNPVSGWNNLDVTLNVPYQWNEHVTVTGFLRYNEPFEAIDRFETPSLSGGVTLRFEF